jgi:hypothetical protein
MAENFVLVPGAWHGGWAWQPVASRSPPEPAHPLWVMTGFPATCDSCGG